jgi:hypothetical protein
MWRGLLLTLMALSLVEMVEIVEAQQYTLGVGVYPGDPKENFAPVSRLDQTYRNLALHRPVYQSSSYDYNLTAQLITDGIKDTRLPRWVAVSTSQQGDLPKNEREWLLDHNWVTGVDLKGFNIVWVQVELAGGDGPIEVDRLSINARVKPSLEPGWTCTVFGSNDGRAWQQLGRAMGEGSTSGEFRPSVSLTAPSHSHFYRFMLQGPSVLQVGEMELFDKDHRIEAGGPYNFTSAWKSAGTGGEWVYVDLGAACTFDRVTLSWIRGGEGLLQVSDDAANWTTLRPIADDMKLASPARGRYVRLLLSKAASPDGYILSELEVYGRGGPLPQGRDSVGLSGGAWRIQRDSLFRADGAALSQPGFHGCRLDGRDRPRHR